MAGTSCEAKDLIKRETHELAAGRAISNELMRNSPGPAAQALEASKLQGHKADLEARSNGQQECC